MLLENTVSTSYGPIRYLQSPSRHRPLLYLHGSLGDPLYAHALHREWGSRFSIVAPYLPGHGSFDLPHNFTYSHLLDSLSQFTSALNLTGRIQLGHSFGGRLALDLSQPSPSQVSSQILVAPLLSPITPHLIRGAINHFHDFFFDSALPHRFSTATGSLPARIRNLSRNWSIITSVPAIPQLAPRVPTTVICSTHDHVLPDSRSVATSHLSHINYQEVTGGHYWLYNPTHLSLLTPFLGS